MRHVKLAFRSLFRTPFVTAVAVVSLALGIGANAAIFSLFDQMLLQSLPVREPDRLINLASPGPKQGSQSCNQAGECEEVFSYPMFRDLERLQTVLTGLAAHCLFGANLAYGDASISGEGVFVSGSYFPTLGLQPALGRLLGPADDRTLGAHFVTVLSHSYWQSHFGSDPGVLGKAIVVNGQTFEIVGVAPKRFDGTTLGGRPQVFVPLSMRGVVTGFDGMEDRRSYWAYLFGRLKPGVSPEQAEAALTAVYRPIVVDVEAPLQEEMSEATMARFKAKAIAVRPGYRGQSSLHGEARTPLILLFAVTAVVLLIACANIANLLLARGATRATEMGVRLALGAGRGHLLAQLLTEAIILALMGGAASLLVAKWTLASIGALLPPEAVATLRLELQAPMLLFAAGVSIGTGLLFGLFPALHSTRTDLITSIRSGAGQLAGGRVASRFRSGLVTAQIALATALLASAGLLLKSLVNVTRVDIGLEVENVVTFSIAPMRSGYDSTRAKLLYQRVEDALMALPGAAGVASSVVPLLAGSNWGSDVDVQGFQSGPDADNGSRFNRVNAGYFRTLGVRLLAGREFTPGDRLGTSRVAVVNQTFAKKFNLGDAAVGKYMSDRGPDSMNIQIVGVIEDAKYSDVKDEIPPVFYTPWLQHSDAPPMNFYLRSSLPAAQVLRSIPPLMKGIDPGLPVDELKAMPQQIRENVFLDRMMSILSVAFASLATLLAGVGLYGVLAYTVAQRTREIGVRMALGADAGRVRAMVLRQVLGMMALGAAVGVAVALGVGRAAQSLLFRLEGHDPIVFALALLVLGTVGIAAGYIPARRASRVDPMRALRYE